MHYDHASSWGLYLFTPTETKSSVKLDINMRFVVNGNVQELVEDREYDIVISPSTHPKYGDGYTFVVAKEKKPETIPEQHAYIRAMLSESIAEEVIKNYPNEDILKLMKEDKFDYKPVKGMGEKTYRKARDILLTNLDIQEALVELKDLNITYKAMKQLIEHFGSASVVIHKVKENIYSLCEVSGFGFVKVDRYALNRGDSKENRSRIVAAFKYILEQEEQSGHSWVSKEKLLKEGNELLQIDPSLIKTTLDTLRESEDGEGFYFEDNRIALRRNYFYESKIKEKLMELIKAKNKFKVENIDEKIEKVEEELNIKYSEDQREAIRLAVENNVFILNGYAGTGKTTVLRGILGVLSDYTYACCALSGKASKIMTALGLNGMTIHRMLSGGIDRKFLYNSNNPLPHQIVVLDEGSMCSNYIMYSVITAVESGSKLIILGDSGQLAAIGAGAVFEDIIRSGKLPMKELAKVHRQAEKSGVLSVANRIRKGEQIIEKDYYEKRIYGELKDLVVLPVENRDYIKDVVIDICKNYKNKDDLEEFQVIVGLKSRGDISVKNLNIELQKIFNDINKPYYKRGGYEYREGDKVIQHGNNYETGENKDINVYNGTMGKIKQIKFLRDNKAEVYIKFDGIDEIICYTNEDMDKVELGYAISVHKSQGSTIHHVVFAFDYASYMLLSKQFVYTGLTRASKGCVMVCELEALRHAIRTDHSGGRNTFLYDLLIND